MSDPLTAYCNKSIVRYQGEGEWSALYINGKLDTFGDHYLVDERIQEIFSVEIRYGGAFLANGNVLKSLEEIKKSAESKAQGVLRALVLREQAAKLIEEARRLEA